MFTIYNILDPVDVSVVIHILIILVIIDTINSIFQMHLSCSKVIMFTSPIVESVGNIRCLLNFCYNKSTTCRMDSTGLDKEAISLFRMIEIQYLINSFIFTLLIKLRSSDLTIKTHIDFSLGSGFHDIPKFIFSV